MLELRYAELEILDVLAEREPQLLEGAMHRRSRALAHADRVAAPARGQIASERPCLVAPEPAALGEIVREPVHPLGRQRDGSDRREHHLLGDVAQAVVSGLGHGASPFAVAGGARAWRCR